VISSNRAAAPNKARAADKPTAVAGPGLEATPVDAIQSLPGFKVEPIYSVPSAKEGSWLSLTVDYKGLPLIQAGLHDRSFQRGHDMICWRFCSRTPTRPTRCFNRRARFGDEED